MSLARSALQRKAPVLKILTAPPFPASVLVCQREQGYQSGFMAGVADSGFGQCPPGEGC